jgi:riboflavin synthase
MFTGIITATTDVREVSRDDTGVMLAFKRPNGWSDIQLGESIASNGVCLTVAAIREDEYDCFAIPETLAKSTFGTQIPARVNLERSLQASDRFGGHFVQGHVDGIGTVTAIEEGDGWRLTISFDPKNRELVILKGSITINGVALTVTDVTNTNLTVALIPHTLEHTTIGDLRVGDAVNLEFDVLGKYVLQSLTIRNA